VEPEEEGKFLNSEEMTNLDLLHTKTKYEDLYIKVLQTEDRQRQLEADNLKKQAEICHLKSEARLRPDDKIIQQLTVRTVRLSELQVENKKYVEQLREKYDVSTPGLGYDPESGRIVENDIADSEEETT